MRIQTVSLESVDILIVDDDACTRKGLRLLLEQHGYRCVEAGDGREALALARAVLPRCVLLDLRLPDLNGFTVARKLRADRRTFSTHIHCLTGLRYDLIREQALQSGCDRFLTKPVDPAELLEVIGRQIEREPSRTANVVSRLTKEQAEQLLDWLENHGCTARAVTLAADGFVVRCLPPPGLQLIQDKDGRLGWWRQDQ
jgi:two-component system cell cycle response regulator DivK